MLSIVLYKHIYEMCKSSFTKQGQDMLHQTTVDITTEIDQND